MTGPDQIRPAGEEPPPPPSAVTTLVRRDIWRLQPDDAWQPIPLAYAEAVTVMQSRPSSDPTSWSYQAAIHGAYPAPPPGAPWRTCQHRSWYFLPWHRMYLHYFERIVRSIVVQLGGPADFALPYWNYDQPPPANQLPLPFRAARLPDGRPNPLHVGAPRRRQAWDAGASMPHEAVTSAAAMAMRSFVGPPGPGFGGGRSAPTHFGGSTGGLEQTPHNAVHPLVGGPTDGECQGGLMTDPWCAALDPIFWLHHANIDRLWTRWLALGDRRGNPDDAAWLTQTFTFFAEDGAPEALSIDQFLDTGSQLGYVYDDAPAPVPVPMSPVPEPPVPPELGAASEEPLRLVGDTASVDLVVPQSVTRMLRRAFAGSGRLFLNVEDIVGDTDPGDVYAVYLTMPAMTGKGGETRLHVGNLSFFGMRAMNDPDVEHDGAPGLDHTFEITDAIAALADAAGLDLSGVEFTGLSVTFEPLRPLMPQGLVEVPEPERRRIQPVQVGRVSLFVG